MKEKIKNLKTQSNLWKMLWYCLKCRKNTENKNPKVARTKNRNNGFIKMCKVW